MVARVVAADDFRVKRLPVGELRIRNFLVGPQGKGMTGRADADQRFARRQVSTHRVELVLQRKAAAHAEEQQVGILQRGDDAGELILVVIPEGALGLCEIIDHFADNTLFAPILTLTIPDLLDAAGDPKLKANREKLIGMSTAKMREGFAPARRR